MALTQAIRDKVESWRDLLAPKIVSRQNAYFAAHGRYWQGILTPSGIPADAADTAPESSVHPSDQLETWLDFLGVDLPSTFPCSLRIDAYNGPLGHGYTVTAYVGSQGEPWTRTWEVGPEDWRAQTWHRLGSQG